MELKLKFQMLEKQIAGVHDYDQLMRVIRKEFDKIVTRNFVLHYIDEDGDQISVSNQDDFDAINYPVTLIIEETDEAFSDDSFQKLSLKVSQQIQNFRKLSGSLNSKPIQQPIEQSVEKLQAIDSIKCSIKLIKDKISLLQAKEDVLRAKQLPEKPALKLNNLLDDLQSLELFKEIADHESRYDEITKQEKGDLDHRYRDAMKTITSMIAARQKRVFTYKQESSTYKKSIKKHETTLKKAIELSAKKIPVLNKMLMEQELKLQTIQENEIFDNSIALTDNVELEQQLDKLTRNEIKKAKKQKAVISLQNTLNQELQQEDDSDSV